MKLISRCLSRSSHAKRRRLVGVICAAALIGPVGRATAEVKPPFQMGECRDTRVAALTMPVPPDRRVDLINGLTLHYYQDADRRHPLRPGQPVRVCLVHISQFCRQRESNTRTYLMFNIVTQRRQFLPDAAAPCARTR